MNKFSLITIMLLAFIQGMHAQEKLDVETILARADSVYTKFKTARFIYESKVFSEDGSNFISSGKIYIAKSDESPLGYKYHSENFTYQSTQIYDGTINTTIDHKNKTYRISRPNSSRYFHFNNGPQVSFFKKNYLKNLSSSPFIKSMELLSDTIIDGILCYQIKVISDPKMEGYSDRQIHYFFQKENFFCKGSKTISNDLGINRLSEDIIVYAEVNKELDKNRFKYHKNIKTNYKKLAPFGQPIKKDLLKKGKKIPKFKAYTLDNKKVTRKNIKDQITVLDFWFIHCPPCRKSMPVLDSISSKYNKQNVKVIGFNPSDSKDQIKSFKENRNINLESLVINYKIANKFNVTSYPTLYIIDQEGKVAYAKTGYSENLYSELSEEIEKLLFKD